MTEEQKYDEGEKIAENIKAGESIDVSLAEAKAKRIGRYVYTAEEAQAIKM